MTRIKLCGLSRACDIEAANEIRPDYVGFVFAAKSRRRVSPGRAAELKKLLDVQIRAVGVFVDEEPEQVAELLESGVIDLAQLHGREDAAYIEKLRLLTKKPLIQAFRVETERDAAGAEDSAADFILLDSGAGGGRLFDWNLLKNIRRPFFLAGGLDAGRVALAVRTLHPYGVDVSSGIETDGWKDKKKMAAFAAAVRKEEER